VICHCNNVEVMGVNSLFFIEVGSKKHQSSRVPYHTKCTDYQFIYLIPNSYNETSFVLFTWMLTHMF